jgi:ABC-type transport system involved in multi-copper enzyme maturation permease subunit
MIGVARVSAMSGTGPPLSSAGALRLRVVPLIARQDARDAVFGWPLYVVATVAVLAGALLLSNALQAVAESGLEIVSRPFYFPVMLVTSLAALYLAGWATLAIARPRDQGALRVLFFAPVDAAGLVAGHALSALLVYAAILLVTTPVFFALAFLVNLPFPPLLLLGIALSPLLVLPAIGIGLVLSALASSARTAIFLFAAILAGLIVVQVGYGALQQVPPTTRYYDALLFLREVLGAVREALRWLSPLALLSEGLDAALRADWRELSLHAAAGFGGGLVWLALATWALNRRGVLP